MYHLPSVLCAARRHLEQVPSARVAALAQACGVSPPTLARAVRAETGLSYRRWQHIVRLEQAACLLRHGTARSVKEVSADLGFVSQQGFTRWLKRATGLTPTAYRQHTAARAGTGDGPNGPVSDAADATSGFTNPFSRPDSTA